jgi:hypothetical protein
MDNGIAMTAARRMDKLRGSAERKRLESILKISKRAGPHFRQGPGGMVLVATRVAGQPPQFPPIEYLHGEPPCEEIELGPTGTLYSYTVVHAAKDKAPYGLAMVDFEPGVRAFGRLLYGEQPPAIGAAVRVVPHALADGTADYAFQEQAA